MIALMNVTSLVPLWLALLIVAVLSAVLSWLLVALVRRWWPHPTFKENNEFVGFTYAVYGLIYGVVLALPSSRHGPGSRMPRATSCARRR